MLVEKPAEMQDQLAARCASSAVQPALRTAALNSSAAAAGASGNIDHVRRAIIESSVAGYAGFWNVDNHQHAGSSRRSARCVAVVHVEVDDGDTFQAGAASAWAAPMATAC